MSTSATKWINDNYRMTICDDSKWKHNASTKSCSNNDGDKAKPLPSLDRKNRNDESTKSVERKQRNSRETVSIAERKDTSHETVGPRRRSTRETKAQRNA